MTDTLLPTQTGLELRAFGIRRTGNHAVISWIIDSLPGVVVHLNNVRVHEVDPYLTAGQIIVKGLPYYHCRPALWDAFKKAIKRPSQFIFAWIDPKLNLNYIKAYPHKNCLIYSYENCSLAEPLFNQFPAIGEQHVGTSHQKFDIVIAVFRCVRTLKPLLSKGFSRLICPSPAQTPLYSSRSL
ncbi:MAG: hypothetical protein ACK5CA_03725 [Cyanobacteriota bacterium]|jgi:hypothetical protein